LRDFVDDLFHNIAFLVFLQQNYGEHQQKCGRSGKVYEKYVIIIKIYQSYYKL